VKPLAQLANVTFLCSLALAAGSVRADGPRRQAREGAGADPGIVSAVSVAAPAYFFSRDAGDPRMRGRMSPEERRRLREDIFDASRNLYSRDAPDQRPLGR
jgi:hypothetical protein